MTEQEKLEEAKRLYTTANADQKYVLESLFPELKESEDERIRKALKEYFINSFQNNGVAAICGVHIKDVFAWLEKQGNKPFNYENANIQQKDFAPKSNRMVSAWAKEALYSKPVWSEEDEQNLANSAKTCKDEQNSAWSEEDERNLQGVIDEIEANKSNAPDYDLTTYDRFISWLKSLKERYAWKPSDEQMDALQYVFRNINPPLSDKLGWDSIRTLELLYHDLKKLKEE